MGQLTPEAQQVISDYLVLPFPGHAVNAPYFNNQRGKVRAGLRVLIGKGSPQEIVEEAHIIALRDRVDLKNLSDADLKKFLVEQNLGVDCSALAYYILNAESQARGAGELKKILHFTEAKSLWRKLLTTFRPVENSNVSTLAHDKNSESVELQNIQPGDMIILWRTREDHLLNHLLIVHAVQDNKIFYTHSFRWSKEGKYDHGVRQGEITITDVAKPLAEQQWEEKNVTGENNETLKHVQLAENVEVKRLCIFLKTQSN